MTTLAEKRQRFNDILGIAEPTDAELREMFSLESQIKREEATGNGPQDRQTADAIRARYNGDSAPEVRGEAGEQIRPGQMRAWLDRAADNGVQVEYGSGQERFRAPLSAQGTDRDMNRYWAERCGLAKPSVETRGLLEDTVGSAQAITPQAWSADFVDVLLPNTILGRVGANLVPMPQETVTVPVFTSTVSPSWVAENGSISLDANPAFSPLALFAPGGFKDTTQFSIEAAQDAYIKGNLDGMLANAVAAKMAVVLDVSALLGVASNTGIPGLINESGFVNRRQTGDAGTAGLAPTTTTECGVVAELTMKANAKPNAFVSNIGVHEAYQRIALGTYGHYFDMPPITDGMDWVTSENSAMPYVETSPASGAPAQTGGTFSSLYCGPWDRFTYLGVHLELVTRVLTERYIDTGNLALFSWCRYSIRFAHPETFQRTHGVITV